MDVKEILRRAVKRNNGEIITNSNGFKLINEAMMFLGVAYQSACKKDYIECNNVLAGQETGIHTDFIGVVNVNVLGQNAFLKPSEYIVDQSKIIFKNDGNYKVNFMRLCQEVNDETDVPEINKLYIPLVIEYVAIMARNEENAFVRAEDFLLNRGFLVNKSLKNGKKRGLVMPVGSFR